MAGVTGDDALLFVLITDFVELSTLLVLIHTANFPSHIFCTHTYTTLAQHTTQVHSYSQHTHTQTYKQVQLALAAEAQAADRRREQVGLCFCLVMC